MPHSRALHLLTQDPAWSTAELPRMLEALTEAASEALDVPRVSVWWVDEVRDGIDCADLFVRADGSHSDGLFLPVASAPGYFQSIGAARVVAVDDALTDPRTRELAPSYLIAHGIGAMLDAPILVDGALYGVVCHENFGARTWSAEERSFAGSIGDLAALAVQTSRRREAEVALREREAELRFAVEAAGAADWSWDVRNDLVRWSPQMAQIFGRPDGWLPDGVNGFIELVHPDDREHTRAALAGALRAGSHYLVPYRVMLPDGSWRWVESRGQVTRDSKGKPLSVHGLVLDINRQREVEEQLARSQRLESLGRLAGGVAHDFNNLLTAITGAVDLLLDEDQDDADTDLLELISSSADRATRLTSQLLAFGSRLPTTSRAVDVARLVHDAARLLERLVGEDITVEFLGSEEAWVWADPTHIEQLVVNLVVNARDAMPTGGELTVSVEAIDEQCVLKVRDTGHGIEPAMLERIFDPFFTTKAGGDGTGLGLAICHGIVEQIGGRMNVTSEVGVGTCFRMEMPLTTERPERSAARRDVLVPLPRRHVLVVEDDDGVARFLVRVLEALDQHVQLARTFAAAMEALAQGPPDILLCDMVLPGGSGVDIIADAQRRYPQLPIVMMTGYAPRGVPEGVPLLTKPFTPAGLREAMAAAATG